MISIHKTGLADRGLMNNMFGHVYASMMTSYIYIYTVYVYTYIYIHIVSSNIKQTRVNPYIDHGFSTIIDRLFR